jgi:DNA-binding response OmpR family regulator
MSRHNAPTAVVAAVADLMFGARIRAAAEDAGRELVFARTPAQLAAAAAGASLVLLDLDARWLDAPTSIRELRGDAAVAGVRIVAFGSHVRTEAIAAAREAGADRVLARSAFVKELRALLAE